MRTIILLLIITVFSNCTKENNPSEMQEQEQVNEYFLNFDIEKVHYMVADQELKKFSSVQLDPIVTFQDITTIERHFYVNQLPETHPDSISLLATIDFQDQGESTFESDLFSLEIFINEDKSNLVALSDSTYRYSSNEILHNALEGEWGNSVFLNNDIQKELFVTLPNPIDSTHVWGMDYLSSNAFYFENENLEMIGVDFNESEDEIEIIGKFEVSLKILSCGFYSFYHISNADFKMRIK